MEISKRVEKFIEDCTRNCSSDLIGWDNNGLPIYTPWLTPDQAREAIKIAREEMIEKVCEYLEPKIWAVNMGDQKFTDECINDLKEAMGDE